MSIDGIHIDCASLLQIMLPGSLSSVTKIVGEKEKEEKEKDWKRKQIDLDKCYDPSS